MVGHLWPDSARPCCCALRWRFRRRLSLNNRRADGRTPAQPADQKPPDQTPPPDQPTEAPKYEDQVIVTASRVEQKLVNAPATVSLISAQTIASAPSASYAELLRGVPGMNVTQTSARDINLVSRSATGTLSTSQLALIDGRSIYQDFFGFVAWDFLPVINTSEIKQIEVIRGPASAVWGANALTGVVNVITKSPREILGESLIVTVGTFGRDASGVERSNGSLFSVSGSHAAAPSDTVAYKITAGFSTQEALARPSGLIPNGTNTPYPDYENSGTSQPKFDVRVDYDFPDKVNKLVFAGGFAGTEGMIHTGIGPFDIDRGTFLAYGKVNYSRGGTRVNAFVNHLDGDATNRLSRDITGVFIPFSFKNTTFDVEASDVRTWRNQHVFSYGGNVRYNTFDLSLAPLGDSRTESRRLRPGRVVPLRALPRRDRRPRRQVLVDRRRRVLAADHVHVQAGGVADGARVVQPRLSRAVARQQLPRRDAGQRARSRRPQSGPGRPAVHLPGRRDRQCGPEGREDDRLRDRLHGHHQEPRHGQRRLLRQRHRQLDLLHADRLVPRHQPAAGLAAAAGRSSS